MPKIGMIWAQTDSGVIGLNNQIPWHVPEDLKRFNQITRNSTVIMGKATWLSLPERFRPLPARRNLVLSSDLDFFAEGAEVFSSLERAFSSVDTEWAWIIGGSRVYSEAMLFADRVEVTKIGLPDLQGDTFAPVIPYYFHCEDSETTLWHVSQSDATKYRFESYSR